MKVKNDPDSSLTIKHFPVFISFILALLVYVVYVTLAAPLLATPPQSVKWLPGAIALLFVFLFSHFMWEPVEYKFDSDLKIVKWRRRRAFTSTRTGEIAFSDINDVIVRKTTDSEGSTSSRIVLIVNGGEVPMTNVYNSYNNRELADKILEVLTEGEWTPRKSAVDELIKS